MKYSKFFIAAILALAAITSAAQDKTQKYDFKEATELTVIGKLMDTPQPYDRVDTVKYKGWTEWENFEVRTTTGIAVVFKTDSKNIVIDPVYGKAHLSPNAGAMPTKVSTCTSYETGSGSGLPPTGRLKVPRVNG